MEGRDELIDLRGHDREYDGRSVVDRGESVDRAGGNDEKVAPGEASAFVPELDLEQALDHTEGLIRCVVDMPRGLITRVRVQLPPSHHEVEHVRSLVRSGERSVLP